MKNIVIYIHGQGGSPEEAEHYQPLFPDAEVVGLHYTAENPWQAKEEFPKAFDALCQACHSVTLIANSIGAYFAMCALGDKRIERAFFISPVVDMQKLIEDMMLWAGVREAELQEKGEILTSFGQTLSWDYLRYAKENPIFWKIPTHILYGSEDNLTDYETISRFAHSIGSGLTVMEGGEHWFHTDAQMDFLDRWLASAKESSGTDNLRLLGRLT